MNHPFPPAGAARRVAIPVALAISLFGALGGASALLAARTAHAAELDAAARAEILAVEEIRPGMIGIGRTVFHGTEIEEFQVEILGVLKKISPDGDIILGRASGGPLAQTGILEGMSGSPVYVDGKIIGAVAYSWAFAKDAITGITPIGEMLKVMERVDLPPEERADASETFGEDLEVGVAPGSSATDAGGLLPEGARLRPIRTPIVLSGFDPRVAERIEPWLEGFGFTATPGGGGVQSAGAGAEEARYEPVPGAAVGVQLLTGDAAITAIGTVTHRAGDRIIAFGHPLFMAGDVNLPMTGAYIHGLMPSSLSSFKLGSPLAPLGTLTQDRRTAISGNIGPAPALLPIAVSVRAGGATRAYHYDAVRNQTLTPGLVQYAAINSLVATESFMSEQTIDGRLTIRLSDGRSLALENRYTGPTGLDRLAEEVVVPTAALMQNRFEKVAVEGIEIDLSIAPGRSAGKLEAIRVAKNPVRPGETLTIEATVKPHQGPSRLLPISIAIPAGAADGELVLRVCDAPGMEEAETKRAPQRLEWENLDTFLASLAERRRNDRLYVQLESPDVGVTIAGREFPSMPRSVFAVIDSDRHTENAGVASASVLAETEADAGLVVSGCKTIPVRIDHMAP